MTSWIEDTLGIGTETADRILWTIVVVAIVFVIRILVVRAVNKRLTEPAAWFRTRKTATYVATVISFFAVWRIWFTGFSDVATFLGLVSAGLAIALADVLKNLAGWLFIVIRRPFRIGDRIQLGTDIGDIVDIRAFRFSIMEIQHWVDADQPTGRIVDIPNGRIFTESTASYTDGFSYIWHELPVLVTFESNWQAAEALIRAAMDVVAPDPGEEAREEIRQAAMRRLINLPELHPGTYVSVRDSGVAITARMLIPARNRRGIDDAMWRELLDQIDATADVELAYPTMRTHLADELRVRTLS